MKSWLSNQSFSTWIKSHVELIKEGRNVKVIAKKYVFRCAFFFFLHIIYTHSSSFQISLKFSLTFSFLSVYLFLSRTWFFHDYSIIIRSAYIRFVKLEWNYWKIKIFATEDVWDLYFFFYFKDQDEFYTRWIVLKWNKFVIDKKKKAIMLEERRKWETLIVIKLVLRNWLVY